MSKKFTVTLSDQWAESLKKISEINSIKNDKKIDELDLLRQAVENNFDLDHPNLHLLTETLPRNIQLKKINGISFNLKIEKKDFQLLLIADGQGYIPELDTWKIKKNLLIRKEIYEYFFQETKYSCIKEGDTIQKFYNKFEPFRILKLNLDLFIVFCYGESNSSDWWKGVFKPIIITKSEFLTLFDLELI